MNNFVFYNPNPDKRKVGDCAVRALCMALDMEWEDVFDELAAEAKEMHDMPSANRVWGSVLMYYGFQRKPITDCCPTDFTVNDFCQKNPTGIYVLGLDGHVVTVCDGHFYDIWDSGDKTVEYYWTLED